MRRALQQRSLLQVTVGVGSMSGLENQAVSGKLWDFARSELEDTKLLVEKINALGGEPAVEFEPAQWHAKPPAAIDALIEAEDETIAALHAVIRTPARSRAPRRSST